MDVVIWVLALTLTLKNIPLSFFESQEFLPQLVLRETLIPIQILLTRLLRTDHDSLLLLFLVLLIICSRHSVILILEVLLIVTVNNRVIMRVLILTILLVNPRRMIIHIGT